MFSKIKLFLLTLLAGGFGSVKLPSVTAAFSINRKKILFWVLLGVASYPQFSQAAFFVSLSPSPVVIAPGGSSTLRWTVGSGADAPNLPFQCSLSSFPDFTVDSTGTSNSMNGEERVSPGSTTSYTFTCTDNAGAVASRTRTVTVSAAPVVTMTTSPSTLPIGGGSVGISWDVGNATSCTQSGGNERWRGLSSMHLGGSLSFDISTTTVFSLSCTNSTGTVTNKSVTVTVGSGTCGNGIEEGDEACDQGTNNGTCPKSCSSSCAINSCGSEAKINISASPRNYDPGEEVDITWSTESAVSCRAIRGEGFVDPIGTSGRKSVRPTKDKQNYSIECFDATGLSATDQVVVRKKETEDEGGDVERNTFIDSFTVDRVVIPYTGNPESVTITWKATPGDLGTPCYLTHRFLDSPSDPLLVLLPEEIGLGGQLMERQSSFRGSHTYTFPPAETISLSVVNNLKNVLYCGSSDPRSWRVVEFFLEQPANQVPLVEFLIDGREGPVSKTAGSSMDLSWKLHGPDRCTLTNWTYGGSSELPADKLLGRFSLTLPVTTSQTYALECWNGTHSRKVSVEVIVEPLGSPDPPGDGGGDGDGGGGIDLTCSSPNSCNASCSTTKRVGLCSSGIYCCAPVSMGLPPVLTSPFTFGNPVAFSTLDGNDGLFARILTFLQGFIVLLALIFIVIGGFLYITSAGDEGRMETAKKCILAALIGLALGIAAPAFLREIASILNWGGVNPPAGVGTSLTLIEIASRVLSFLLTIIGILAIIMLIIGGIMYLTAAGDEDQIDRGKKIVKYSLIGITIALAALVLVRQVAGFFS
jgi:hypothetical protein